ncbi:MAG: protein kinase, partial [Myxococcota bacterium]
MTTQEDAIQLAMLAFEEDQVDLERLVRALLEPPRSDNAQLWLTQRLGLSPEHLISLQTIQHARGARPSDAWQALQRRLMAQRRADGDADTAIPAPARETPRYHLGEEVGRGGAGKVLLAEDRYLRRSVAMKIPLQHKRTPQHLDRFLTEAQATGSLEHPNIVPVYDLGINRAGELFYTMKYMGQNSLRRVLHYIKYRHASTLAEYGLIRLLTIFNQMCMALDYAHAR